MSDCVKQIRHLLASSDDISRKDLIRDLHEAILSIETPRETATRVALYTAAARMGQDLNIFEILDIQGRKSLDELQELTGAHPVTLARLLRYMASVGHVHQIDTNHFGPSQKSHNFADPEAKATITHFFENCGPLFQEMPAFLRKNHYQDITNGSATVFQPAYRTELDTYTWFSQNPENLHALIRYMGLEQDERGRWLDEYPFEDATNGWKPDMPVFVDVGGNVGHYCALFKAKYPDIAGHIVLEDLPGTLEHALPTAGVVKIEHDFFKAQPIRGSKFYHLGWILHNWSDAKAKEILIPIRSAMSSNSVLLINDMVLPEAHVPAFASALDLVMLGACGSLERTLKEWTKLLNDVGLQLRETIVYSQKHCHAIIAATLIQ